MKKIDFPILTDMATLRDILQPYCQRLRVREEEPHRDVVQVDAVIKPLADGSPHPQFFAEVQRYRRIDGDLAKGQVEIRLPSGRTARIAVRLPAAGSAPATPVQDRRTPTREEVQASLDAAVPIAYRTPPAPTAVGHLANRQTEELSQPPLL